MRNAKLILSSLLTLSLAQIPAALAQDIPLTILYEDDALLVVVGAYVAYHALAGH